MEANREWLTSPTSSSDTAKLGPFYLLFTATFPALHLCSGDLTCIDQSVDAAVR